MCNSKSRIMRWLLGLAFLAAIVGTAPAAYAAACPGGSLELISMSAGVSLGGGSRHVGDVSTTGLLVMTNTSSCDGVGENVTMGQQLNLVPACTVVPGGGTTCASPDNGVITVTSASSDAGACTGSAITWTVGGGPGAYTLTNPGGDIPLAAGGVCTVHFSYTVNKLPTVDAKTSTPNVLDTGQSIAATLTADSGSTAGGTGSNSSPFTFTCTVKVDKQVSCNGGTDWHDLGLVSTPDGTADTCNGVADTADIKVRYFAQNTGEVGVSCTIGESNTTLGPGVSTFTIDAGLTTAALGTSPSALTCNDTLKTGEPDTATLNCTCQVPLLTPPSATASDDAKFGCDTCSVTLDKQISCDAGATWQDANDNNGGIGGCIANVGSNVTAQYIVTNTGTLPVSCNLADSPTTLLPNGATITSLTTSQTVSGTATACNLTSGQSGQDTATLSNCTCPINGTTTPASGTLEDTAAYACAGVKVDKEVSCNANGAPTFSDTTGGTGNEAGTGLVSNNDDGTNGCIASITDSSGNTLSDVAAKWFAKNIGNVDLNCTLHETNATFQTNDTQNIALGAAAGMLSVGTPNAAAECTTAKTAEGADDTATITCTVSGSTLTDKTTTISASDKATFDCCGVQVDKQVSCDGTTWHDVGLTVNNGDAADPVTCTLGSTAHFQYFAKNVGTVDAACTFSDTQNQTGGVTIFPATPGTITVGSGTVQINGSAVTEACSLDFSAHEPNTGLLSCTCGAAGAGQVGVTANDQASVACVGTPGVTLSKACAEQANGTNHVTFTVNNTGNETLTSCTVTDTYYPGSATCPPSTNDGTTATVSGSITNLGAGLSDTTTDTADIDSSLLTTNFCNTAHVSCTAADNSTVQADANPVVCPVPPKGTCITRTPGYFGTHPAQTDALLDSAPGGQGISVCGLTLTSGANFPKTTGSAVEDLCENANDAKKNNVHATSPQQLQLTRQCTAAALSLLLSGFGGGGISGGEQACTSFSNIQSRFETCCTANNGGICNSGASPADITASGCEGFLDAFNNQFDAINFPQGFTNAAADSSSCTSASGNQWINPRSNVGPAK